MVRKFNYGYFATIYEFVMRNQDKRCYTCKYSEVYGYNHWGCSLTGDVVSQDDYCLSYEED